MTNVEQILDRLNKRYGEKYLEIVAVIAAHLGLKKDMAKKRVDRIIPHWDNVVSVNREARTPLEKLLQELYDIQILIWYIGGERQTCIA